MTWKVLRHLSLSANNKTVFLASLMCLVTLWLKSNSCYAEVHHLPRMHSWCIVIRILHRPLYGHYHLMSDDEIMSLRPGQGP